MLRKLYFSLLIIAFATIAMQVHAQNHEHKNHSKSGKVRCAFDGMRMKKSAMVESSIGGKTLYFCNSAQEKKFKAAPNRYLKRIHFGHVVANLNIFTIREYKAMMKNMGMSRMVDRNALKGKTHHLSVYWTQHTKPLKLGGVNFAIELDKPNGRAVQIPLTYNKMMKTYDASINLPKNAKISVAMTSAKITIEN